MKEETRISYKFERVLEFSFIKRFTVDLGEMISLKRAEHDFILAAICVRKANFDEKLPRCRVVSFHADDRNQLESALSIVRAIAFFNEREYKKDKDPKAEVRYFISTGSEADFDKIVEKISKIENEMLKEVIKRYKEQLGQE